jgi:2-polyprenyl-6-methoxyphenol hydroxylase-like FAD-dependent oxidoreductase
MPLDTMYFVFGKRAFMGYWRRPDGVAWFSNLPREKPLTAAEARAIPASAWLDELGQVYADDIPGRDLVAHTRAEDLFVLGAQDMLQPVPHWHRHRMVLVGDAAHAPSSSSGQGASLAIESSVELARCLRDCASPAEAFAAYERLRRPRVEAIAAAAARTNSQKASGPIAKLIMNALLPIALKTFMSPRRMFGSTHGFRIDWESRVTAA